MASIPLPTPARLPAALEVRDLVKRYPTGTEALRGVSLDVRGRRVLRTPRPERRRQVHADPLHDGPRPPDVRLRARLRPRRRRALRAGPARGGARAAGRQPRLLPHARGDARLPRRLLRHAPPRAPGAHPRAPRRLLPHGQEGRPDAHAVGRHEAAADPGPRAHAPAPPAHPRRADGGRRRGAAAGAVALRAAHQRRGHDDPPDHALPRGGGAAVRPDRLHQRGADRGARDEPGAGRPLRRGEPGGRLPGARRPQGAVARRRRRHDVRPDPLPHARAARGQPLPQDQAPDARGAAAGDLPLHLRLRRGARLAHRPPARDRLRRLHHPRADHDGLGDERLHQQLVLDPAAEVPARDRRAAVLPRLSARAPAGLHARRLPARDDRRHAHLHRRLHPRGRAGGARARARTRARARGRVLRPARGADRRPRGAVRRRLLRPDVRPAAADLPRRRLLLRRAAAGAVPDADPVQPRLLHDRPRPVRVPGLLRRRTSRCRCSSSRSPSLALFTLNHRLFVRGCKLRA